MGILLSLFLGAIVLGAAVSGLTGSTERYSDQQLIARTELNTSTIADMMAYELRMLGSGMPLGQANFRISDATLGTASLPLLLVASPVSRIAFRLNEQGVDAQLTASYTPAPGSLSFTVTQTTDLLVGDTIYISNMPQRGADGLQGVISAINTGTNTVTINSGYIASLGVAFASGSVASRAPLVTYNSPSDWSGITRNSGTGTVVLAPNSTFTLQYLDNNGADITAALTRSAIETSLTSLNLTVRVRSDRPLLNGSVYTAQAASRVTLRNLIMSR